MNSLIDEAEELRMQLVQVIHKMKVFDERELSNEFKRITGRESLGLGRTIREFLFDLTQLGVLHYDNFRYRVK